MSSTILLVLLSGLCFMHCYPHEAQDFRPVIALGSSLVVGKVDQVSSAPYLAVHQYLGVPFAKSPPTRFEPPEDVVQDQTTWDASYFRPSCFQSFQNEDFKKIFNNPPLPESEDCLYLNVFKPATVPTEGLPVLFWIHGGSFALGSARISDYDGSSIAANQGVVVVTTNYRTNVFGFPGDITIPFDRRNIGLLDQRKALSWVHANIRAFGGDPSKITIFGESAGGWSVKQLLVNPPSPPQFRAAILQSQAFGPETDNEESWNVLVDALGCSQSETYLSSRDCIAKAPAESIQEVLQSHNLAFTPIVDNITNGPSFQDAAERSTAKVPILIGTNAAEGTILASVMPPVEVLLEGIFGNDSDAKSLARSAYPDNSTDTELKSWITTDYTYTCATSAITNSAVSSGHKVWRYYFNASFPNNQPFEGAGAWHTSEIPLVFGTYRQDNETLAEQVRLSRSMQQAWGDFAKYPELGPGWAAIGTSANDLRLFDTGGGVCGQSLEEGIVDAICKYFTRGLSKIE
ncbi:hypothetical protein ACHAPI_010140 [Fusarium lateritium]